MPGKERQISPAVAIGGGLLLMGGLAGLAYALTRKAGPPENIALSDFLIEPTEVYVGDSVSIGVTVTNAGAESISYEVTCSVNGQTFTEPVTLEPGESERVTFIVSPTEPGTYHVNVDGKTGSFVAFEAPVTTFQYISPLRREYFSDHRYLWEVDVRNTGSQPGEFYITVYSRPRSSRTGWHNWRTHSDASYYILRSAVMQPGEEMTFSGYSSRGSSMSWQTMVKSAAGTILDPTTPLEFLCRYCWELFDSVVSFATEEELEAHIASAHPQYAPMPPLTHFFVRGVIWPGDIEGEGPPIGWYCTCDGRDPDDGRVYRGIDQPCEFSRPEGWPGWHDGTATIPNTVRCIEVHYMTATHTGWLCDSPMIYRVPDSATVAFDAYSRGCRNWRIT